MGSYYTVPLIPNPQQFTISLSGITYTFTFNYRNNAQGGWVLDIGDANNNPIAQGLPLVTGSNMLKQLGYLGFSGGLFVQTLTDPDAVPTFANLGSNGLLFYVTNP